MEDIGLAIYSEYDLAHFSALGGIAGANTRGGIIKGCTNKANVTHTKTRYDGENDEQSTEGISWIESRHNRRLL